MIINSEVIRLNKSAKQVYDFLKDGNNYKILMADHLSSFQAEMNYFSFALKGMPVVTLCLMECIPNEKILWTAPRGKIPFSLCYQITEVQGRANVQIFFKGQFNAMLRVVVRKPLNDLIDVVKENLKNI